MNWELFFFRLKLGIATIVTILLGIALTYGVVSILYPGLSGIWLVNILLMAALFLTLFQYLIGPYVINALYRAVEVDPGDPRYGWVYEMVAQVARENRFKEPPKVYIADIPIPNAFAYGNPIAGRRVAITVPLLRILSREELRAVIGHEIGHLRHRDVEVLMAVGLLPTVIYWLGYTLLWSGAWGGGNRNGGALGALIGVVLLVASFVVQLAVLYLNRLRESYADINAVLTVPGSAPHLQRALAKIVLYTNPEIVNRIGGTTLRMLFFTSPVSEEAISTTNVERLVDYWRNYRPSIIEELFSTHPHPAKRIQLLDKFRYTF